MLAASYGWAGSVVPAHMLGLSDDVALVAGLAASVLERFGSLTTATSLIPAVGAGETCRLPV